MPKLDDPASRLPIRGFERGAPEWMAPLDAALLTLWRPPDLRARGR